MGDGNDGLKRAIFLMELALRELSEPQHDMIQLRLQMALDSARGLPSGAANDPE